MELLWWLLVIVLFAVGLLGTVVPVLPGTTIILAAVIFHRIMLGADKSVSIFVIGILVLLTRVLVLLARILILVRHRDLPC